MASARKPKSRRESGKAGKTKRPTRRHSKLRVKQPGDEAPAPTIGPGFTTFADFDEAVRFLYSRVNAEALRPRNIPGHVWKLERMHALMEALDNPHRAFKSVHVAGSKGKGSVCEMVSAALGGCGLTTGLYTSPHVCDIRERIRLNGELVSHKQFVSLVSEVALAADSVKRKAGAATFFELMTAAAFLHFAREAVGQRWCRWSWHSWKRCRGPGCSPPP